MPIKGDDGGDPEAIARREHGVGWIAHPEETMRRASHAIEVDGDVWLVDPLDAPDVEDVYADLGEVVGVVVALDRHKRDAAAFADRHGVSVYVPTWMRRSVEHDLQAPVETFEGSLPDTNFRAIEVVNNRFWKEVALYDGDRDTLVVPEAVGTADYFLAGDERLGVHPMRRALPPRRALGDVNPDRVLVGHGTGVTEDATTALHDALAGSRRRLPSLYLQNARMALPI